MAIIFIYLRELTLLSVVIGKIVGAGWLSLGFLKLLYFCLYRSLWLINFKFNFVYGSCICYYSYPTTIICSTHFCQGSENLNYTLSALRDNLLLRILLVIYFNKTPRISASLCFTITCYIRLWYSLYISSISDFLREILIFGCFVFVCKPILANHPNIIFRLAYICIIILALFSEY